MIINSRDYNGKCSCGKCHNMTTEVCIIEEGCFNSFSDILKQYGIVGYSTAIYDENTYRATETGHPCADCEIILPPQNLHADNHAVAMALAQIPENTEFLIAVGSGTIHDITRYCAFERKIPFVSCPTAASVDGFCSSVAAMTWDGFKKTFTAVAPKIVVADTKIIKQAPMRLTNSGVGDMIGKYIALTEWKIGHILTDEYLCDRIYQITAEATANVLDSVQGIKEKETAAFEKLMYGLCMSGLAMQMLGFSRCASGAEHHISHFIEMQPVGGALSSDALHGEKVGVGTLLARKKYQALTERDVSAFGDYKPADGEEINRIFGEVLGPIIQEENTQDCAVGITADCMCRHWAEICSVINDIPSYETLSEIYDQLGMKKTLEDIGVDESQCGKILKESPLVRNRLTLMRLARTVFS